MSAKDMTEELMKAQVLVEALPYIQRFNRKIIVIRIRIPAESGIGG